jgi:phosphatidylglycerol---prolipoprotein diacylglyceryl transferase
MDVAYIPSPSRGVWHLGPLPIRGYALCIILGVIAAVWISERRWVTRGGRQGVIGEVAIWAVPFGIVGARIYHVITTPDPYFGDGGHPWEAFAIWKGGIGIWGAISMGALGAWIACRRQGVPLPAVADVAAPGIAVAQAIGRWGNWFNQELYGKPTDVPWALKIDLDKRVAGYENYATFHPTFLYESLWVLALAGVLIWAERRYQLGHGRLFALCVAGYTLGRAWIEYLRIDTAHRFGGLRLNDWVSFVVFVLAVTYIVVSSRVRPGREDLAALPGPSRGTPQPGRDQESSPAGEPGPDRPGTDRNSNAETGVPVSSGGEPGTSRSSPDEPG